MEKRKSEQSFHKYFLMGIVVEMPGLLLIVFTFLAQNGDDFLGINQLPVSAMFLYVLGAGFWFAGMGITLLGIRQRVQMQQAKNADSFDPVEDDLAKEEEPSPHESVIQHRRRE
jgi:hypothetical protein